MFQKHTTLPHLFSTKTPKRRHKNTRSLSVVDDRHFPPVSPKPLSSVLLYTIEPNNVIMIKYQNDLKINVVYDLQFDYRS